MPAQTKKPASTKAAASTEHRRFWLNYPAKLITRPLIWEMSRKFDVVFDIRQASVGEEVGIVCIELDGKRDEIKAIIRWLEKKGVTVEPVEINVIES
ncbi:MAG TPA: NIL domain-containing protein [Methylomirabilota bacterium]|nr:NIL domain-containing protein [Methylomirabilota bacterium]